MKFQTASILAKYNLPYTPSHFAGKIGLISTFIKYLEYREGKDNSVKPHEYMKLIEQLFEASNKKSKLARLIIKQTIEKGWIGFYPLKKESVEIEEKISKYLNF